MRGDCDLGSCSCFERIRSVPNSGSSTVTTSSRSTRTSRGILEAVEVIRDALEPTWMCRTRVVRRAGAALSSSLVAAAATAAALVSKSAARERPLIASRLDVEKVKSAMPYNAGRPSQNLWERRKCNRREMLSW